MNQLLAVGDVIEVGDARTKCTIRRFLGGGGQGEVYEASLGRDSVALKWYFPWSATPEQARNLELLVQRNSPSPEFLWPLAVASSSAREGFGYVMPLREARFRSIVDLMKRRVEPAFATLATAGFNLAQSFLTLHSQGYAYKDISFGNVFFDPTNGDIVVADNDNVAVDRAAEAGVAGTPLFMAPEIVRGEALPSSETDLFSLAVLLFYMFVMHHPLEGRREMEIKCLDLHAMQKLYGIAPVFIYDPDDDSNRPVPGYHDNAIAYAPIYPRFLKDLFAKSFTVGLREPQARVRESEWRGAMIRLRDSIFFCGNCSAENFFSDANESAHCWSCKEQLETPFRLRIDQRFVMLNHNTQLFDHHITAGRLYAFGQPRAAVTRHPSNPSLWGLQNLSTATWTRTGPAGEISDLESGKSAYLEPGARLNFGGSVGIVER